MAIGAPFDHDEEGNLYLARERGNSRNLKTYLDKKWHISVWLDYVFSTEFQALIIHVIIESITLFDWH